MKGLLVKIVKEYNCSNNGISARYDRAILVGPEVAKVSDNLKGDLPIVRIENHYKNYYRAVVVYDPSGRETAHLCGGMFGGNFIYSSDSRFPFDHPVKLHDRYETWEQYEALSR